MRQNVIKDRKLTFKLTGLDCPDCVRTLEEDISKIERVESVAVDPIKGILIVSGRGIEPDKIRRRVKSFGLEAGPPEEVGVEKTTLLIPDMDCADEEKVIRKALGSIDSVSDMEFDLIGRKVTVRHDSDPFSLLKAVNREGFKARVLDMATAPQLVISAGNIRTVIISAVLVAAGAVLHLWGISGQSYKAVILVGVIVGGWKIGRKGLIAARRLRLDMNFLMSAAVLGAIIIGQWVEAGTVIVMFAIAQLLESLSLEKSKNAIRGLMELAPDTATVIRDGREIVIPSGEISLSDRIIIKPGEKIAVDGRVTSGNSSVNQAAITGESLPVEISPGSPVFAGTVNGTGALEIKPIHIAGDTTLDKIIRLVEEARSARAPSQGFVDRFSEIYTPLVVGIAAIIAIIPPLLWGAFWIDWIYRSLTLLVIACPCAMVISTPVTIVSALTAAAHNGVLIKGGVYLENLHKTAAVAFDKTGTITKGTPSVVEIIPINEARIERILELAASLEKRSEHPIASAIIRYSSRMEAVITPANDVQSIPGRGAKGMIDGKAYYIGSPALFEELGLANAEHMLKELYRVENESRTAILVGTSDEILGIIAIADEIKSDAARTVANLGNMGVKHIVMLTGDNSKTALAVGKSAGFDDIRAELLPADKARAVEDIRRQYGSLAMVGDGVNDAPALAASDIGIAMGVAGSDLALETADIALMSDELSKIPWAFRLSRKAYGIIIQNIAMAIGIKAVFIALALTGEATLWMAVFADMGVSLMVIFNGMRALRRS